nr:Transposon Ty3-G Gag-Pol polyprotein [Ipomoea batatas]
MNATSGYTGHTPFKQLVKRFENEFIVAGGKCEPAEVMSEYGFNSRALEVTKWSLNLLEKFFDADAYHLVLSLSFDSMATDNSPQEQSESPPWAEPLSEIRQQLEDHSHYHLQTMQALQCSIHALTQTVDSLQTHHTSQQQTTHSNHVHFSPSHTTAPSRRINQSDSLGIGQQPFLRIDLPKFDGKDPHAWIFQSQEFFEYHNVPPNQRLSRFAFMVHGEASEWFRWRKSNSLLRSWDDFLEQVKLRFDPLYFEDFTGRLSKLQQITTVAAYRAEYEKILNKVTNVPETVLISMFIAGLKSTICREVQLARPQTLVQTFVLAAEIEAQHSDLLAVFPPSRPGYSKGIPAHAFPEASSPIINPRPLQSNNAFRHPSNSNPLPVISMTPAEKQAKLSRGECYTCNSKWTKNHKCPNRALLLFCSEDEAVAEQNETVDDQFLSGDISSLNSMAGPGTPRSLRLQGLIDGKPIRVLIDGGSTHNFIQPAVAEQLHLQVKSIPPFRVYIGNGDSLRCTVNCEQVPLYLNGTLFPVDLFVLPIKGSEIVLGVQWLQDLGDITHNYAKVSMEFSWLGKNVQLLGDTTPRPLEISAAHLHSLLLKDEVHGCFELFSIEAELPHKEFA